MYKREIQNKPNFDQRQSRAGLEEMVEHECAQQSSAMSKFSRLLASLVQESTFLLRLRILFQNVDTIKGLALPPEQIGPRQHEGKIRICRLSRELTSELPRFPLLLISLPHQVFVVLLQSGHPFLQQTLRWSGMEYIRYALHRVTSFSGWGR